MRRAILIACGAVALGCTAVRYEPTLDRHPGPGAERLLGVSSVAVSLPEDARGFCEPGVEVVRPESAAKIQIVKNESESWPGRGFQCFEPMLYVLSLGIIPADCRNDYDFEAIIEQESGTDIVSLSYSVSEILGWVALPLAMLPSWEFSIQPRHCERALSTALRERESP